MTEQNARIYEHSHMHTHIEGQPSLHVHEGSHSHGHMHPNAKAVSNRLARAIGHLESVKRMVDSGRDCSEVLVQLAAVRSAINNAGKVILMDHLTHCIVDAVQAGDQKKIDDMQEAIKQFVK